MRYLLILVISLSAFGQAFTLHDLPFIGSISFSRQWIIDEDFEGSGEESGWGTLTSGGASVNWDYTPPIDGSHSFYANEPTGVNEAIATNGFISSSKLWVYFKAIPIDMTNACLLALYSTYPVVNTLVYLTETNTYQILNGTLDGFSQGYYITNFVGVESSGEPVNQNKTNHIWLEYESGSGSDSVSRLWVSLNATRGSTPNLEITTGTSSGSISCMSIGVISATGASAVIDTVKVSADPIESNP